MPKLSAHCLDCLDALGRCPRPRQDFNPGVTDKLSRLGLVETFLADSPYRSHKPGTKIDFIRRTKTGDDYMEGSTNA